MKKISQGTETYPQEVIYMMNDTKVCLNCGKILKFGDKEKRRNRGYCNLGCYITKPPRMAYAEKVYQKPIKDLILENLNSGRSITATAGILGINRQALHDWLNKMHITKKIIWR